jgi:8-oxo-dGTP diphosphatase
MPSSADSHVDRCPKASAHRQTSARCEARQGVSPVGGACSNPRVHKVVVGALIREGRVLLVHRRRNKRARPDVWDLPGGLMETDESELGALARELHEELGVRIATGTATHLCRVTAGPAEEPALLSAWLVSHWRGTPANVAPEEHDDIGWFGLEELPPPPHVVVRTALLHVMRSHQG